MLKITLDTNCLINILDSTSTSATSVEEISEIIRYGLDGDVSIAITTRAFSDIDEDKNDERKKEIRKRIAMFPAIGTTFRLDTSKLDSQDFLIDEKTKKISEELQQILFPSLNKDDKHFSNKINDVDHLVGHIKNGRDIFVTDDKDIIRKAEIIHNTFNIKVFEPKKCLEYINLKASKTILVQEFYEKLNEYKNLLQSVATKIDANYTNYPTLREWLLRKYPLIKDGLLQFKLSMFSVPVGGQVTFDRSLLLELGEFNERIQELFMEPTAKEQFLFLVDVDNEYNLYRYYSDIKQLQNKIDKKFHNILDLLISYSGYLEKNF